MVEMHRAHAHTDAKKLLHLFGSSPMRCVDLKPLNGKKRSFSRTSSSATSGMEGTLLTGCMTPLPSLDRNCSCSAPLKEGFAVPVREFRSFWKTVEDGASLIAICKAALILDGPQ